MSWCQDINCSHYDVGLDEDGKCHGHDMSATSIRNTIVDLTDRFETEADLWEAYKLINKGLSYLSAKHTMAKVKEESDDSSR
tara:strand:+ start:348 stop:593 length:246 start_codon:yes stop_codon:yes gene_type:complete